MSCEKSRFFSNHLKRLKYERFYYKRWRTGYMEEFLSKIDPAWNEFFSKLYDSPRYLDLFRTLKCCHECQIFFGFGKTNTDTSFEDAFEFTPGFGGERIVFCNYFFRDPEGEF